MPTKLWNFLKNNSTSMLSLDRQNQHSGDKLYDAKLVIDSLLESRLSMLPQLKVKRTQQAVRVAECEIEKIRFVSNIIDDFCSKPIYNTFSGAIKRAIETDATHLLVNVKLGNDRNYTRSNLLTIDLS